MSEQLTIIAHLVSKPDKIEQTKAFLLSLVDEVRAEKSCVDFDLHQDSANPAEFTFYENWVSRAEWDKHMDTPHIKNFIRKAPEMFAVDPQIRQMTMLTKRA